MLNTNVNRVEKMLTDNNLGIYITKITYTLNAYLD